MNQTTKRVSGYGSAMIGPASGLGGWRRGPLLAPEDAASGAAGGSSGGDGTSTPTNPPAGATTTTSESGTAPGAGSEKMLPQSQVNALVAAARREGAEKAQRESQQSQVTTQQPKPSAPKSADDRLSALEAELEATKQRGAFDKHAAKLGIADDLAEDLFELAKTQRPQDLGTWLATKAERFGAKPAPAASTSISTTASTTVTATEKPVTPPPAAPGAPVKVDGLTNAGITDIFRLSDTQISQLGPSGLRKEFEKIVELGHAQSGAPQRPKLPGR
jgi:hypothetical protein